MHVEVAPRWIVVGAALTLSAALVGVVESQRRLSGDRPAPTAPIAATPATPATGPPSSGGPQELLEARLAANPTDLAALNDLTTLAVSALDVERAFQWNDRALELAPLDPDARVNRAIIAQMTGMDAAALSQLDGILADFPNHPAASVFKGLMLMKANRPAEALPLLETGVAAGVSEPEVVRALADARHQVALVAR